jgi:hypothetical protein
MTLLDFPSKLRFYIRQMALQRRVHPQTFNLWRDLGYFPDWYWSWKSSPISQERPWITYLTIEFLEKVLTKEMRVCEYGVGGSTLFYAKRVKELVSVEHEGSWAVKVTEEMKKRNYTDWELRVVAPTPHVYATPPDLADPDNYLSSKTEYQGMWFKEYAGAIDSFPDGHFDVVQVDGRVRPSCAKHALKKIKKGGYLVVDDTHRPHYSWVHTGIDEKQWRKFDGFGPGPHEWEFRQTCIWEKLA